MSEDQDATPALPSRRFEGREAFRRRRWACRVPPLRVIPERRCFKGYNSWLSWKALEAFPLGH